MRGDAWKAAELIEMVRTLQPQVIINNRLECSGEGYGSLAQGNPTTYHGDFVTPEQFIPPYGLMDPNGLPVYWEANATMNRNWGYHATDRDFKPASMLIHKLVECVSKGGNFLLNVGPDANGNLPEASVKVLGEIGRWMKFNSDSVYGCGPSGIESRTGGG